MSELAQGIRDLLDLIHAGLAQGNADTCSMILCLLMVPALLAFVLSVLILKLFGHMLRKRQPFPSKPSNPDT